MRDTTQGFDAGLRRTAEAITQQIAALGSVLPSTGNYRPPLPAEPYALNCHREMSAGRSTAVLQIVAVLDARLKQGVPFEHVVAIPRALERFVEVRALDAHAKRQRASLVVPCWTRETRAQQAADLAQMRAVLDGDDESALVDAIEKTEANIQESRGLRDALEVRLALARSSSPRRVYGNPSTRMVGV